MYGALDKWPFYRGTACKDRLNDQFMLYNGEPAQLSAFFFRLIVIPIASFEIPYFRLQLPNQLDPHLVLISQERDFLNLAVRNAPCIFG